MRRYFQRVLCTARRARTPGCAQRRNRLARELAGIVEGSIADGPPELPLVREEPPLKPEEA